MVAPSPEPVAFDAAKHLTKVSGRDYLEVKWRLVWLRTEHPDAQIATEMMQHEKNAAVFRARVMLPTGAEATGWGQETADDFGDYIEKAETKALGRALAALGFGTQFCQDYDFGADRQRVVDAPIDVRGARPEPFSTRGAYREEQQARAGGSAATNPQPPSPKQITYLNAICREMNVNAEGTAQQWFGKAINLLTRREVSQMIEQLQADRNQGGKPDVERRDDSDYDPGPPD